MNFEKRNGRNLDNKGCVKPKPGMPGAHTLDSTIDCIELISLFVLFLVFCLAGFWCSVDALGKIWQKIRLLLLLLLSGQKSSWLLCYDRKLKEWNRISNYRIPNGSPQTFKLKHFYKTIWISERNPVKSLKNRHCRIPMLMKTVYIRVIDCFLRNIEAFYNKWLSV